MNPDILKTIVVASLLGACVIAGAVLVADIFNHML